MPFTMIFQLFLLSAITATHVRTQGNLFGFGSSAPTVVLVDLAKGSVATTKIKEVTSISPAMSYNPETDRIIYQPYLTVEGVSSKKDGSNPETLATDLGHVVSFSQPQGRKRTMFYLYIQTISGTLKHVIESFNFATKAASKVMEFSESTIRCSVWDLEGMDLFYGTGRRLKKVQLENKAVATIHTFGSRENIYYMTFEPAGNALYMMVGSIFPQKLYKYDLNSQQTTLVGEASESYYGVAAGCGNIYTFDISSYEVKAAALATLPLRFSPVATLPRARDIDLQVHSLHYYSKSSDPENCDDILGISNVEESLHVVPTTTVTTTTTTTTNPRTTIPRTTTTTTNPTTTTPGPASSDYNPCTRENISKGLLYHAYPADETKFIHCDAFGRRFVMNCWPGTRWIQAILSCAW